MDEYVIVVLGVGGVGKSALLYQLIARKFIEHYYDPTLEDTYRKSCLVDGEDCLLDILDTAGPEDFSALRDQLMKIAHGFLIVYSITSPISFTMVSKYRNQVLRFIEEENIPIVIVGNKCDLETERKISKNEALNLSTQFQCQLFETSAKDNINVEQCFFEIVRELRKMNQTQNQPERQTQKKCCIL